MMTSQVAQGAEIANQVGQAGQSLAQAGMV
jgi:hypothetical protein